MTAALIALPVLFALSAFFSSAETVLFSLTGAQRARIRSRSPDADMRIGKCLDDKAAPPQVQAFSAQIPHHTPHSLRCTPHA